MPSPTLSDSIDNLLIRAGVPKETIIEARSKSTDNAELGAELENLAGLAQDRFAALIAERLGLPFSPDIIEDSDPDLLSAVTMQYCRRNRLLPLRVENGRLRVATADPVATGPLDDLRVLFQQEIDPVVVPAPVLLESINRAYDRASAMSDRMMDGFDDEQAIDISASEFEIPDLLEADDEAPIIKLVNTMIFQAAKEGASDIHIEPFERNSSVRFRIDGMLIDKLSPPRRLHAAIASRIKVMASMDIAEKRLPQDGGIRTRVAGRDLDVRVSTLPTSFGERVVMRLLDRGSTLMGLEEIGFGGRSLETLRKLIKQSHGIILVTGPTGSGKTTTLYAGLSEINSVDKNIITIEDPIEYQIPGIGQIQVNPKIDLSFAAGLRSILRQDPDVIMVGEIRDAETARIAIQAALTGHLVLSTLHTNDSFSAITRLLDMGIEPFLVSSSLIGVVAQRLVRKICPACSQPVSPAESGLAELGLGYMLGDNSGVRAPSTEGCEACRHTGFQGRSAIHEMLAIDDTTRSYIMQNSDAVTMRDIAVARGMATIRDAGAERVRQGITSVSEVLRVTTADVD
jgi:general secretion pathway protein E